MTVFGYAFYFGFNHIIETVRCHLTPGYFIVVLKMLKTVNCCFWEPDGDGMIINLNQ